MNRLVLCSKSVVNDRNSVNYKTFFQKTKRIKCFQLINLFILENLIINKITGFFTITDKKAVSLILDLLNSVYIQIKFFSIYIEKVAFY